MTRRRRRPQGGKVADPAFRIARAKKAGAASAKAMAFYRARIGERYDTKGQAYVAGYRRGYQTCDKRYLRRFGKGLMTVEKHHRYTAKEFRAAAANFRLAGNEKAAHMLEQAAETIDTAARITIETLDMIRPVRPPQEPEGTSEP